MLEAVLSLETPQLRLRELTFTDAPFILQLLNDPEWLRFIGDRDVRTLDDAHDYLERGPLAMYERRGHGLWLVQRKADEASLGMCGIIARDTLPDVDLGFAFLREYRKRGYAFEAAAACVDYARTALGKKRIVAITALDNRASARLLERLGFSFEAMLRMPDEIEELRLFARALEPHGVR